MISALGLDDFPCVWVFVGLQLTRLPNAGRSSRGWSSLSALWIEQVNDVLKAEAILIQQATELGFEFDFFLQGTVAFQRF